MTDNDILVTVAVISATFFVFVLVLAALLVSDHGRRSRHRAELAELALRHEREVMQAEREASHQTLREMGRELHDNVGQLLTVVQMGMNSALQNGPTDPGLEAARDALDLSVEQVRRLGRTLNSELWQPGSLVDAITAEAERIERVGRVRTIVEVHGEPPEVTAHTGIMLYRLFQETIANALRHSGADTIRITLRTGPRFSLTVADNGRGFDPAGVAGKGGLANIPERCGLIGFNGHCEAAPGKGCTWTFTREDGQRA